MFGVLKGRGDRESLECENQGGFDQNALYSHLKFLIKRREIHY